MPRRWALGPRQQLSSADSRASSSLPPCADPLPDIVITTSIEVDAALAGWYRDRVRAFAVSSMLGMVIISVALALVVML